MIAFIQTSTPVVDSFPVALTPIHGKPILAWQLESLARNGIGNVLIAHDKNDRRVPEFVGDGKKYGLSVRYIEEGNLGTCGAFYYAVKTIKEDFLFLEGDVLLDIDFERLLKFHRKAGAAITALARPSVHTDAENILIRDPKNKALHVLAKNEPREIFFENLTPAGIYAVSRDLLLTFQGMGRPVKMDIEEDLFLPSVYADAAYVCVTSEYVRRYREEDKEELEEAVASGVMNARNLSRPQKAVFLDRDGVLNVFGDYVVHPDILTLKEDAAPALKRLNQSPYIALCVTNQPIVAMGKTTLGTLKEVHNKLEDLLAEKGAFLDGLYCCPHFPPQGNPQEIPELSIECDCRKPKIGMLLQAKKDWKLDLSACWFVGDTLQDVQTGINAGCRTILITTGDPNPAKKCPDAKPDFTVETLEEAASIILKDGK
ncbi:MAG: HAD-IIIA family hydrolase [Bacilli bacterium]|nr:HAD-IIIA family hydrolase [Bacilli bacterium]